ncbi:hemolysin III family protein [soil metagenome]
MTNSGVESAPLAGIRRLIREPFCGLSHLVGAALSIVALIVMLLLADGRPWHVVSFSIYGASLILLYSASGFAHSLHCSPHTAARLDRYDYAAIFLLIAGTYTPVCLISLGGALGWSLLLIEWLLAAVGVATVLRGHGCSNLLRTCIYLAMAWLAVGFAPALVRRMESGAIAWLLVGGAVYSLGAIVFVRARPTLWPGRFGSHDLWHCLVLVGSACHFIMMILYVA